MSRNSKRKEGGRGDGARRSSPSSPASPPDSGTLGLSVLGRKSAWAALALLVLGFAVLSQADPMGRNLAAHAAPFLILGGYALLAFALVVRDPDTDPS